MFHPDISLERCNLPTTDTLEKVSQFQSPVTITCPGQNSSSFVIFSIYIDWSLSSLFEGDAPAHPEPCTAWLAVGFPRVARAQPRAFVLEV